MRTPPEKNKKVTNLPHLPGKLDRGDRATTTPDGKKEAST